MTNIATDPLISSRSSDQPIRSIAVASFGPAGQPDAHRVTRSWKSVTSRGLMITRKPQVAGAMPCVLTAEIGSTVSKAT
jgi:hypothetical protein